jgi:hypothetical protein
MNRFAILDAERFTREARRYCWHRAQPGQIMGPRHARPKGAARGSGPAASGEFDRTCACLPMKDEGTGALIEPKNMDQQASWPCRNDHSKDTVTCPTVGETAHASHRNSDTPAIRPTTIRNPAQ